MSNALQKRTLVLFSLPAIISAITHGPVAGVIPALYASTYGLDLAVIGAVLLLARVFDAVTDPAVGYLSDRTESKFGKRKPWFMVGSLFTVFSCYFLFVPGESASMTYFLTFSILLYLGWTLMEIPFAAWGMELSRDTKQRARINGYRTGALFIGGILFTIAPQLVPSAQGQMNFEVLEVLAIGVVILIPITSFLAFKFVPQGQVFETKEEPKLSELWKSVKSNKPFKNFIAIYIFIGLASGVSGVLTFMYMDSYLQLGELYTQIFIVPMFVGPLMLPVWVWLMGKYDKYRLTAISFTIYTLIMPIPWFIQPGEGAFIPMAVYYTGLAMFAPLLMVAMPTILGDVVDYDEHKTGKNRAGQYYSFLAIVTKGTAAVGGPLAMLALGLFGYQPGAENSEEAITALRFIVNILPTILVIPGVYLLFKFPLNDKKQAQIKLELEQTAAS